MKITHNHTGFTKQFFSHTIWLVSIANNHTSFSFQYLLQQERRWQDIFHGDVESHAIKN